MEGVSESLRRRYLKKGGAKSSFGDARSTEAKRRLADRFKGDGIVTGLESYGLLKRLLDEQCEIVEGPPALRPDDADANETPAPVVVKPAREAGSDPLETPHDAGVTYSGRKGKGLEAQTAETCCNEQKPEMITCAEETRSCDSDQDATVDDPASRNIRPEELLADTNYGSTEKAIGCEKRGAHLARCPAGHQAVSGNRAPGTGKVRAFFDESICAACNMREGCPARPLRDGRRVLRTTVHAVVLAKLRAL